MKTIKMRMGSLAVFGKDQPVSNLGPCVVHLEKEAAVYAIDHDGAIVPLGFGSTFRLETDAAHYIFGAKGCVEDRSRLPVATTGEAYTNIDRRHTLSPAEQAVTLALRRLQRKEKAYEAKFRQLELDKAKAEQIAADPATEGEKPPKADGLEGPESAQGDAEASV